MKQEHEIIQQVYEAKEDMQAADQLIRTYLPFIKTETAKFLQRPPIEGQDDELSIAMIAFHEAILGYSRGRGAFLTYAAMLIRSRLIDYSRKERRHSGHLSLDTPMGEVQDGATFGELLSNEEEHQEVHAVREATKAEIEELSRQMEAFGVSLTDVAENCPRQQRTLEACRKVLEYAKNDKALLDEILRTRRLPMTKLAKESKVELKTLERHRKYILALLLICTNGYEIIRGHLQQVLKGGVTA